MGIHKKVKKTGKFLWQAFSYRSPKMAYVGGWQGHRNLGDEAVYGALKQLFYPANFVEYNKNAVPCRLLKFLPVCEAALLAGGTVIGQKKSAIRWAENCFELCSHRIVFGAGVTDPSFLAYESGTSSWQEYKQLWKGILEKFEYIGVRGPMSAELLTDFGLKKVEVIGDPVLSLSMTQFHHNASIDSNTIGINVGQAKGSVWGSESQIFEEYIRLATLAKNAGWRIKWFVVWPGDLLVTKQIAVASKTNNEIYELYEDYNRYVELVAPVSVFVGMKLHAVALATCAYVPSVMLEYQPKCRDYMMSIEQDGNTIRTDNFKAEAVWEMVTTLNVNRKKISESLFRTIKPLCELQNSRAAKLMINFRYFF
ncbi:hypothetical protein ES703_39208 [subsurface metagenome]